MAEDSGQFFVGTNAQVNVASVGTWDVGTLTDATSDPGGTELGFLNDDGIDIKDARTIADIRSMQQLYATRRVVTGREFTAECKFQQIMEQDVWDFAFGGAGSGWSGIVFTPPDPNTIDERAFCITAQDGDKALRIVIPKGLVTGDVTMTLHRGGEALLPVTFSATPEGSDAAWYAIAEGSST